MRGSTASPVSTGTLCISVVTNRPSRLHRSMKLLPPSFRTAKKVPVLAE
jgi:hypothetical protein